MLNEFIGYLKDQVGQPYVWGAQHLTLKKTDYENIISRKEEDATHENNAIKFCKKKFDAGAKILYAYDCSGLGMYWLQNKKKLYKTDMSAHNMMKTCEMVSGKPKKGYWVFRLKGSKATHIGYMVNDEYVVHSKGRAYGVVIEKYSSSYWHAAGIPAIFKDYISGKSNETYTFTRNLRCGCKGEDVKMLKKLLKENGYGGLTLTNANFFGETKKVVMQFQKDKGLDVDGIVGPNTIAALGGVLKV